MTEAQAREYLGRCRVLFKEAKRLHQLITLERTNAEHITPNLSGMPMGGGYGDKVGDATQRLIELEKTYKAKIRELAAAQADIEKAIAAANLKKRETDVLVMFYVQCRTGAQIASMLYTSDRNFRRWQKSGVANFAAAQKD